jgi:hypothetical protein
MAKSKTSSSKKKPSGKPAKKDFVVVSSKSYGAGLKGTKIYFEGTKPTRLREDGTIGFGKNYIGVLEQYTAKPSSADTATQAATGGQPQ